MDDPDLFKKMHNFLRVAQGASIPLRSSIDPNEEIDAMRTKLASIFAKQMKRPTDPLRFNKFPFTSSRTQQKDVPDIDTLDEVALIAYLDS